MKVLIIVDMQNDFIDGALGTPEAQAIVPNVISKIRDAEGDETLVILTKDTHYEDYLTTQEGRNLPVPHCIYMTPGWSINKEVAAAVDYGHIMTYHSDTIIKSRILKNTFGSIDLGTLLSSMNKNDDIDSIELIGLCTDICVISNALLIKVTKNSLLSFACGSISKTSRWSCFCLTARMLEWTELKTVRMFSP